MKTTTVTITAELEIEDRMIYEADSLKQDLLGESVSIKSGLYENIAWGSVTAVSVKQAIPRKEI